MAQHHTLFQHVGVLEGDEKMGEALVFGSELLAIIFVLISY